LFRWETHDHVDAMGVVDAVETYGVDLIMQLFR
jgi:hypothetical protein